MKLLKFPALILAVSIIHAEPLFQSGQSGLLIATGGSYLTGASPEFGASAGIQGTWGVDSLLALDLGASGSLFSARQASYGNANLISADIDLKTPFMGLSVGSGYEFGVIYYDVGKGTLYSIPLTVSVYKYFEITENMSAIPVFSTGWDFGKQTVFDVYHNKHRVHVNSFNFAVSPEFLFGKFWMEPFYQYDKVKRLSPSNTIGLTLGLMYRLP